MKNFVLLLLIIIIGLVDRYKTYKENEAIILSSQKYIILIDDYYKKNNKMPAANFDIDPNVPFLKNADEKVSNCKFYSTKNCYALVFRKNIPFYVIDYSQYYVYSSITKNWKIFEEMNIDEYFRHNGCK